MPFIKLMISRLTPSEQMTTDNLQPPVGGEVWGGGYALYQKNEIFLLK